MAMDTLLYSSLLPVDCGKLPSLSTDAAAAASAAAHGRSVSLPLSPSKPSPAAHPLLPKGFLSLVPAHEREELWNDTAPSHGSDFGLITSSENDGKFPWSRPYHDLLALKDVSIECRDVYELSGSLVAVQSLLPSSRHNQEDPETDKDFHVNVGYAIRTLREELPNMFRKDLTYDIYREDIVFYDPMNTVSGVQNYKLIFKALRFYGRIFFKSMWVKILRIWQPSDNVIMVRWQVRGVPRVPWEAQGIFDGLSEYKLDKQGKIYEHKVDNIALNSRPKLKVPTVEELFQMAGCPSTPKPTFFQERDDVFTTIVPYLFQFTWVRYYLALRGTLGFYTHDHLGV